MILSCVPSLPDSELHSEQQEKLLKVVLVIIAQNYISFKVQELQLYTREKIYQASLPLPCWFFV